MSKQENFRVCGPEIGIKDSYVDVRLEGISDSGDLVWGEKGGGREWTLSPKKVKELRKQNYMITSEDVKTHGLWNKLDDVGGERKHNVSSPFAKDAVSAAQRSLFMAAFEETR